MAGPYAAILRAAARRTRTKAGKYQYRNAQGQFISFSKYKELRANARGVEDHLRAQLGAPPSGKNWYQIAEKYQERFSDYLEDLTY